ncbi:MAG TPA: alkaline phosphatase family protein [Actinomycetota bacterium]|nr:alkaline phosphatase family protein [Actinomycetota bacterium]
MRARRRPRAGAHNINIMRRALSPLLALAVLAAACSGTATEPSPGSARSSPRASTPAEPTASGPAFRAACRLPVEQLRRLRRGYDPRRSPDLVLVPRAPNYFGGFSTYTHSGPWDYVQEVPLVLYGPGYVRARGEIDPDRVVTVADVAPTLAGLLGTPWPEGRPGEPLEEALVPAGKRPRPPRAAVVVVWDGAGRNVLARWPRAWPTLARLAREGTAVRGAEVGSSPSVTPAIHATIGTGAFPKQHGIVDIPLRRGDAVVGSWEGHSPRNLELATLGDLHDEATGDRAEVVMFAENNWHLGMLGHGAYRAGGDRDVAVMVEDDGRLVSNETFYSLPSYLSDLEGFDRAVRAVDAADGALDGLWMGHDLLDEPGEMRHTPVWLLWQSRILRALVEGEGLGRDDVPDLLVTNFKQIDLIGHDWNMLSPETRAAVAYSDDALADLVRLLDRRVGRGRWVLVVTADHGQSPAPSSTGAWPIGLSPLLEDLERRVDAPVADLVEDERPGAIWLDRDRLPREGVSARDLAEAALDYRIRDDRAALEAAPAGYAGRGRERVFSAVFPYAWMPQLWARCGPAGGGR